MRNLLKITKEDFINLITNPMWIFYATGFPVLLIMILGYLTKNTYHGKFSSYDYYGISLMIYAALNSGMTSANAFMEERIRKPNMRIIYAPGSVSNIYLSKILSSFIFSVIFHLVDLAIIDLAFHIHLGNVWMFILLLTITDLFANVLGVMICCIVKTEACANQLQSILVNLFAILGGVLFSLDGYGKFARNLSKISPVKWVVDAAFQIIYDDNAHLFLPVIGIMMIVVIMMIGICQLTFRKEDCIC